MRTDTAVTPANLNDVMEFDHVIRVHADGSVTDGPRVYFELIDGELGTFPNNPAWRLMTGYTGQYGYRGPIMHSSEFIGGRMARDILATPGLYVALVATDMGECDDDCHADDCPRDDDDGLCTCDECEIDHSDADGWAVAYLED